MRGRVYNRIDRMFVCSRTLEGAATVGILILSKMSGPKAGGVAPLTGRAGPGLMRKPETPVATRGNGMSTMGRPKRGVPEGLWVQCPQCKATIFRKEMEGRLNVCPECEHHFYVPARERIRQLLDPESFEEWFTDLRPCDPLGFHDRKPYADRLKDEQSKTGMPDAGVVGRGFIRGRPVVLAITD